ncbi:hypothetical protein [Synechococcus sp. PCC 6312]|uniref:hypothetical protein n=1 Tax=Synechococcus sp. (strain ATCC 27167 / PCC 6312) TaxID=195253 RepID=UPI00029F30D2|nr:hypothetical protein [Synechococcus sp. PCC 6312]AFY60219.1 hypothetical protein Syn6312_1022 [Synechococcus sp. PCC 6312]
MTTYIVCEGARDAQLLQRLLPEELVSNVEIVAAGGLSAVKSLARSLVARRQSPVVIVADADTTIPEQVEQRLKDTEELVGNIAVNAPVKVVLAVPTLEIVFFQDTSLLADLLGYFPSEDILRLATYQPKQALEKLISKSKNFQNQSQMVEKLTNEDIKVLRKALVIQDVIEFLQSVQETVGVL